MIANFTNRIILSILSFGISGLFQKSLKWIDDKVKKGLCQTKFAILLL
jgi:hypothetical protein